MPPTQASAAPPTHTQPASRSATALQHLGSVIRQPRPLAASQRDVRAVGPVLESVHGVGQAGRGLGEIGRVDLLDVAQAHDLGARAGRSEAHTSELQSLMRISYAVFCLKKKK